MSTGQNPGPASLERSERYSSLEAQVLAYAQDAKTIDERAKCAEILKNIADAQNAATDSRFQRWREISTSAVPLLALLVTAATVLVHAPEFTTTQVQHATQ